MTTLYLAGLILLGIAGYAVREKLRARRTDKALRAIAGAIQDYFSRSGAVVSARCSAAGTDGPFTALIESEPLKRFRYSHIVEASLIGHIHKKTGFTVDKVYWRFPLSGKAAAEPEATIPPAVGEPEVDEYIAEGLSRLKSKHDYTVAEGSWGEFEQALKPEPDADRGGPADPQDPAGTQRSDR